MPIPRNSSGTSQSAGMYRPVKNMELEKSAGRVKHTKLQTGFNGENDARFQHTVPLHERSVMNIHAQIVRNVVRTKFKCCVSS